jgi:hypothetical protein
MLNVCKLTAGNFRIIRHWCASLKSVFSVFPVSALRFFGMGIYFFMLLVQNFHGWVAQHFWALSKQVYDELFF